MATSNAEFAKPIKLILQIQFQILRNNFAIARKGHLIIFKTRAEKLRDFEFFLLLLFFVIFITPFIVCVNVCTLKIVFVKPFVKCKVEKNIICQN